MFLTFQTIVNNTDYIITLISIIINIVAAILASKKFIVYLSKTRYIKKLLGFKTKEITLSQSIFEPSMIQGINHNMITYESAICLNKITTILSECKYNYKIYDELNSQFDEINIGGPTCNKKVNIYLTTRFSNFKFIVPLHEKTKYEKYPINQQFIEYSQEETGFKIYNKSDGTLIDYYKIDHNDKDYIFIIKLTPPDFDYSFSKTVFIMFSGFNKATMFIPDIFSKYYKKLYKRFKKNHFFIAIPFNNIDNTFDSFTGIINLTTYMFN